MIAHINYFNFFQVSSGIENVLKTLEFFECLTKQSPSFVGWLECLQTVQKRFLSNFLNEQFICKME